MCTRIRLYLHAVRATQSSDEADVTEAEQKQRQKDLNQSTGDTVTETERRRLVQPADSLQHVTMHTSFIHNHNASSLISCVCIEPLGRWRL